MARVLIVEDEDSLRETLSRYLAHEGHEVIAAASGQEALDAGFDASPDVLIADWMLKHTQAEVMERLSRFDVLAAPVNDVETIVKDRHVQERGTVVSIPDPVLGDTPVQEVVPRFRNAPGRINWLGKHEVGTETRDFLEEAGFAHDDIMALHQRGIVKAA